MPDVRPPTAMSAALDYVKARAKRQWDFTHSRGVWARLFRRAGAMKPAQGVWIKQYREGNWQIAMCFGEVSQIWRFDGDGLTLVDRMPELDRESAIASTTPWIGFCVDETGDRMIYEEVRGVCAGHGCILARGQSGEWEVERHGFIS